MTIHENETVQDNEEEQESGSEKVNVAEQDPNEIEEQDDQELDFETLRSLLEKEQQQAQANLDLALRAQAEMENLRKRTTRDVENAHKYALEKFVNELLPVIDSMELGMSAAESAENIDDLREGMNLTLKMLTAAIEKFGVKVVNPVDEKFNPEFHEAVTMQEIEGKETNTVVTVMQKGYELNGRLVRPAMVVVAK